MTRLNQEIRRQIVNNAVKIAGIDEEKVTLRTRRAKLAEDVRIEGLGGAENVEKISKTAAKIEKLQNDQCLKKVRRGGFYLGRDFEIGVNLGGMRDVLLFNGATSYASEIDNVIRSPIPGDVALDAEHALTKEFLAIEALTESVKQREEALRAQLSASVASFKTVEKLLKEWPEAKDLLPAKIEKITNLPAIQVKDLNALIGLPKGDDDE